MPEAGTIAAHALRFVDHLMHFLERRNFNRAAQTPMRQRLQQSERVPARISRVLSTAYYLTLHFHWLCGVVSGVGLVVLVWAMTRRNSN